MSKSLPTLRDVVRRGELNNGLTEAQMQALSHKLEQIINDKIQVAMAETSKTVIEEIKNSLPSLVASVIKKPN
jgi:hypothetical protein